MWDYHQVGHELSSCDAAIGLGSHDLGAAAYAAELYRASLFPVLVFSGANSPTTAKRFPRGEAVHYREHAIDLGVPDSAILVEPTASSTGQNISLSRALLAEHGHTPRSLLLISKPYMERRAYATCRNVWPEADVVRTSEPLKFDDCVQSIGDEKLVIDMLVGDLQRVIEYPKLGYAIEQNVPAAVLAAYDRLLAAGFDSRMLTMKENMRVLTCAIHQPNIFPRLSTLAKLYTADIWIVLDNVQFNHQDYQHRARLATPDDLQHGQWLSLPVHRPFGRSTRINEVLLLEPDKTQCH